MSTRTQRPLTAPLPPVFAIAPAPRDPTDSSGSGEQVAPGAAVPTASGTWRAERSLTAVTGLEGQHDRPRDSGSRGRLRDGQRRLPQPESQDACWAGTKPVREPCGEQLGDPGHLDAGGEPSDDGRCEPGGFRPGQDQPGVHPGQGRE